MEYFCNEVKDNICVNFENEEIQDITKAVDILMNRFVDEFQTKYPNIKIESLLRCGSMTERTRVWRLDHSDLEYDYLAVMKSWPSCGDFSFQYIPDGQMDVKYKVGDKHLVSDGYVNLDPEVKDIFLKLVHKCMTKMCERNFCALRRNPQMFRSDLYGCQFCSVCMKSGTLKCINTIVPDNHLDKFRFIWTSKDKSINISYSLNDLQYGINNAVTTTVKYTTGRNDYYFHWKNDTVLEINVAVDFNPVIELDLAKMRNFQIIHQLHRHTVPYLLLPKNSMYQLHNQITGLKYQTKSYEQLKVMYYVIKLLLSTKRLKITKTPALHINARYFLFPKRLYSYHSSWRISTCLTELDIFHGTSEEHRSAYCVLKFLITLLKYAKQSSSCFPHIRNYEAKIAVIRHIKTCDTPRIGTHVCLLNIMHDIALCRDVRAMDHPILHLNLYDFNDILPYPQPDENAIQMFSFKTLILILAYQREVYTVTDLINDLISFKVIRATKQYEYLCVGNDRREALRELKELVQNRKEHSSENVLLKMISSKKNEQGDSQNTPIQSNV